MEKAKNIEEKLKIRCLENSVQIGEAIRILTKWFFQNSEKTIAVTHKVMQINPGVILTWEQESGNIAKWMSVKGLLSQVCFRNSPSLLFLSLLLYSGALLRKYLPTFSLQLVLQKDLS